MLINNLIQDGRSAMSEAIDLIRAILREHCASDGAALQVLDAALELEVDPLDFCAHRFGIGEYIVLERAADWLGVAFSVALPAAIASPQISNLDQLAEIRSLRLDLDGREVQFSAPRFMSLLRLKGHLVLHPLMRRRLCLVPASVIRTELARGAAGQLLDASRQRLARLMPHASAHLALSLSVRLGFVLAIGLTIAVTAISPFWLGPELLPVVGAVLIIPALLRLYAAVMPTPSAAAEAPPLSDAELPVYSVLIPLCDEHQMVPQLQRAMAALDYPALWSKHTKGFIEVGISDVRRRNGPQWTEWTGRLIDTRRSVWIRNSVCSATNIGTKDPDTDRLENVIRSAS
ncbi:MAG TPA: hypothetical protein VGO70_05835 [Arsenicitalea sp.]|nr:hypothetical protein [Arsenicitalea sp.]